MEKPWLLLLLVPHCLWEGMPPCLYIPSLLPTIELVLEMFLWLDVMFGLGLLSHVRRPPGSGQGLGLWALGNKLNLTKVLDLGLSVRVCGDVVTVVGDL